MNQLATAHEAYLQRRAAWRQRAVQDRDIDLKATPRGMVVRPIARATYLAPDRRLEWRAPVVSEGKPAARGWKKVILDCACEAGLDSIDLVGASRKIMHSVPRQKAMWLMKTELGMSLPAIGRRLGGRDHTTILHGIRRHEKRMEDERLAIAAAAERIALATLHPRLWLLARHCS